jgi:hypothetical protein
MDLSEKQLIESVFAGGGDMGARMRAFDWSATDLGPVAQWPQSLRACVRIVLGAGHPMLISWGPNYTMLYNDAYGVVVGTKHPGALGRSCREVLAEAWDFIGPRFDSVYTEGQPISTLTHQMFTFHRKNYLEECYFAFSYSAHSTTHTVSSSAASPNRSPSGWPVRARTSRSASVRRPWLRSIVPRLRSSATSATSFGRRSH